MPEEPSFQIGKTRADSTGTTPGNESNRTDASLDPDTAQDGSASRAIGQEEEMQQLRSLLFQTEIDRINNLELRLNDQTTRAHETGDVLVDAVRVRTEQDDALDRVFEPVVENALKASLRKNPNEFVNVFFPLIGSTIRRSIAESFSSMLASFSSGLEQSLSVKGIRWRIEALRSGRPFNEIVMLHTMVYSVDQVFLIHCETGLVLSHLVHEGQAGQDADLVSGMLTAIQDFARDCFSKGSHSSSLNSLKMDEYTLFLVHSPLAYIACVVQGTPPGDFLERVNFNLEAIVQTCGPALAGFRGDTAPFEVARPYLEDCLIRKFADDEQVVPAWAKKAAIGVGVFVVLLFLAAQVQSWRMKNAVNLLRMEPGIVVLDVHRTWGFGAWQVSCLQDEFARPVARVMGDNGYSPDMLNAQIIPFVSLEPEIIRLRVIRKTNAPENVEVSLKEGILFLSGTADKSWILQARQIAQAIPGVLGVDTSELHDPRASRMNELIRAVESAVIRYPVDGDTPIPADQRTLTRVISDIVAIERLAGSMGLAVNLTIYGHADATGSDIHNFEISQSRAKMIASRLFAQHTNIPIAIYGFGADMAHSDGRASEQRHSLDRRKVDFRVSLVKLAETHELVTPKADDE